MRLQRDSSAVELDGNLCPALRAADKFPSIFRLNSQEKGSWRFPRAAIFPRRSFVLAFFPAAAAFAGWQERLSFSDAAAAPPFRSINESGAEEQRAAFGHEK